MSIVLRPSAERGHANHGWLDTRHTFSFANYYDPRFMGYRTLRVINEDVIKPGAGFGTHGHRDMEIVTYIVDGVLEHKDSTGKRAAIQRGEVQRMTAGSGIHHSEYNASAADPVKLLQIWLLPDREGLKPGYQQTMFAETARKNRLTLLAAPDGRDGALTIHQDVDLYGALLDAGQAVELPLRPGRGVWVQMVSGSLESEGKRLDAGDGAAIEGVPAVRLAALSDSEFLLFDLA